MIIGNYSIVKDDVVIKQEITFSWQEHQYLYDDITISKHEMNNYVIDYLFNPKKYLLIAYCWNRIYNLRTIKDNRIQFDSEMRLFEDVVFNLKYLQYTKEICVVNESLYFYTENGDFLSAGMKLSSSIFNDICRFKRNVTLYLEENTNKSSEEICIASSHAYIHLLIVYIVRICGQCDTSKYKTVYGIISNIINDNSVRISLNYYKVRENNSRLMPLLMKGKQVKLIILLCKYKAHKRYKKR